MTNIIPYLRTHWLGNIKNEILAGMVVAFSLIPMSIAFSNIAGVAPEVGLYSSMILLVITAISGARLSMISGATGAMALVMTHLVQTHGVEYLLFAGILSGILQIVAGYLHLGSLMRFVSPSVVTGFSNALAILLFMAQLKSLHNADATVYGLLALGILVIYGLPYLTKVVPAPLVSIVVVTATSLYFGLDVNTVADMGKLPSGLPLFHIPQVPLNWETFVIIMPYALSLTLVAILESLMTARILDDITDSASDKNKECKGLGVANLVAGFFGAMPGCALIGPSVMNLKLGSTGRLSALFAGLFLMFLLVGLGSWVQQIPVVALTAVMIMVCIHIFDWSSLKTLHVYPKTCSFIMIVTAWVIVVTHDLSMGVFAGVLLSALSFSRRVSRMLTVESVLAENGTHRTYYITGQVFFASVDMLVQYFDFNEDLESVTIDVSQAHLWDLFAVGGFDKIVLKFKKKNISVVVQGMNEASASLVDQLGTYAKLNTN
jgi:SulP family sulfate permease